VTIHYFVLKIKNEDKWARRLHNTFFVNECGSVKPGSVRAENIHEEVWA
jgi:hypothetical protein